MDRNSGVDDPNDLWEYARLVKDGYQEHGGGFLGGKTQIGYDVRITYYGSTGDVIDQVLNDYSDTSKPSQFNRALGLLGGLGWELVSIQHGNSAYVPVGPPTGKIYVGSIEWRTAVAYFKRRVMPGRGVNQPPLVLE